MKRILAMGIVLVLASSFAYFGIDKARDLKAVDCLDCDVCKITTSPIEQPDGLDVCTYTREERAISLNVKGSGKWNYATCWITAVGGENIARIGTGGTLEIKGIEIWGYKNDEAFLIKEAETNPVTWCENRARNGKWDTDFWKGFAQWDKETCTGKTDFFLLSNEIVHVGTKSFDTGDFDNVQCVVTAKTSGGVRFDVGVDFRESDESPAWPAVEGGFSDWVSCNNGEEIKVASARVTTDGESDCEAPK